jgi:hypothetical protein
MEQRSRRHPNRPIQEDVLRVLLEHRLDFSTQRLVAFASCAEERLARGRVVVDGQLVDFGLPDANTRESRSSLSPGSRGRKKAKAPMQRTQTRGPRQSSAQRHGAFSLVSEIQVSELQCARGSARVYRHHRPVESMAPRGLACPRRTDAARVRTAARAGPAADAQRAVRRDAPEYGARSRGLSSSRPRARRQLARSDAFLRVIGADHAAHSRRRGPCASGVETRRRSGTRRALICHRFGSSSNSRFRGRLIALSHSKMHSSV